MSPRDVFTAKKMSGCTVFINDEPWDCEKILSENL